MHVNWSLEVLGVVIRAGLLLIWLDLMALWQGAVMLCGVVIVCLWVLE